MKEVKHICQLYLYDNDEVELIEGSTEYFAENFVQLMAKHAGKVAWLNFHSIDDKASIAKLLENLSIEKAIAEDVSTDFKRARLEEYDDYLFFKFKSALPRKNNAFLEEERISFLIHKKYILSFQEKSSDHFPDVRDRIVQQRGKIRTKKSDFLVYRLLEAIIDNYFEVLEDAIASIEILESKLVLHAKNDLLKKIEVQKRKLIELRRIVYPLRDITSQLEKIQNPIFSKENHYYFSKLNENCLTILEDIEANKQILEGLNNLYYAIQNQRLSEIMKIMTIVSTIFIPLTFIVGVYGMNFDYMPELNWKYGYLVVWGIMAFIALALIYYFKRKGWLKK